MPRIARIVGAGYPHHIVQIGREDPLLKEPLFDKGELNGYRRFVRSEEDEKIIEEIRKETRSGKPLGDEEFLKTLPEMLSCSLSFRPRGRPRKNIKELRD
jgi:hypothetical protein